MIRGSKALAACLLVVVLAACSSNDAANTQAPGGAAFAPAPPSSFGGPTTDTGSRYLDPTTPLGGIAVETPPTVGSYTSEGWPEGSTSIARPVNPPAPSAPASMAPSSVGSPDGLPPPQRRVPPPPAPPPLPR